MSRFQLSASSLDMEPLQAELRDPACGAYAAFEGWVRNRNDGREVRLLEYQAFEPLALKEGSRILDEAADRFATTKVLCVHRVGELAIGDLAVWVGVSSPHRDAAFDACRYVIDEVKHRVPIWKKEHYEDGDSGWVNCEASATHAESKT